MLFLNNKYSIIENRFNSKNNKHTKIGKDFQVSPESIPACKYRENNICNYLQNENVNKSGIPLWLGGMISTDDVEYYLKYSKKLIGNYFKYSGSDLNFDFSKERALYLLHKCNYNIKTALSLISLNNSLGTYDSDSDKNEIYCEEDSCFLCNDGGNLLICDYDLCNKVYHPNCAKITKIPEGEWHCPTHFCITCKKKSYIYYRCSYCPQAYCKDHIPNVLQNIDFECEFLCLDCHSQNISPKKRFYSRLYELMKKKKKVMKIPKIAGSYIDLHILYKTVIKMGGSKRVTDSMSWTKIKEILNISRKIINGASLLKTIYLKNLYLYEQMYYPQSLSISIGLTRKRGRPKSLIPKPNIININDVCDIVVVGFKKHVLNIEININGLIKKGFVFLPQKIEYEYNENKNKDFNTSYDLSSVCPPMNIPNFSLVYASKLIMKKTLMSQNALAKLLKIPIEELASFVNGTEESSNELVNKIQGWIESQSMELKNYINIELERDKINSVVMLENIRLKVENGKNEENYINFTDSYHKKQAISESMNNKVSDLNHKENKF